MGNIDNFAPCPFLFLEKELDNGKRSIGAGQKRPLEEMGGPLRRCIK
jgi:hypothetical protein